MRVCFPAHPFSIFMEIIEVNSKISDVLFSVDEIPGVKYCLFRKINGDLIGAEELFTQSGKSGLMKSFLSKNIYHVCLYHRSNGDIVRRLKVLKKKQEVMFFKKLKDKWNSFYYRNLFATLEVKFASFSDVSNTVEISFVNGKVVTLQLG